jgi:hypothetical protein
VGRHIGRTPLFNEVALAAGKELEARGTASGLVAVQVAIDPSFAID